MVASCSPRIIGAAIAAAAVIASSTAAAQVQFSPIQPVNCSTGTTEFDYRYYARDSGTAPFTGPDIDIADNHYDPGTYLPQLNVRRMVWANRWTKRLEFWVPYFHSESDYDYLNFGRTTAGYFSATGDQRTNPLWYSPPNTSLSLSEEPAYLDFHSDDTVQRTGFNIGRIRLCGDGAGSSIGNTAWATVFQRHTGVLQGTNDVVYMTIPYKPHMTIALWGDPANSGSNDFDVYARCALAPTPDVFDFRGFSGDSQEFIHTGNTLINCQPGYLTIAVHSFRGSGMFNVVVHQHTNLQHQAVWQFDFNDDISQLANWTNGIQEGAKEYFGAIEGGIYVDELHFKVNPPAGNSFFKIFGSCGTSDAFRNCGSWGAGAVNFYRFAQKDACAPTVIDRTFAHEMSHAHAGLRDEYDNDGGHCGHTIMDTGFISRNFNFCTAHDHNSAHLTTLPPNQSAPYGPGWSNSCLLERVSYRPGANTPDNYSYKAFDFNNEFARVVIH